MQERLPLLRTPALFQTAADDPLTDYTRKAATMVAHGRFLQLGYGAESGFTSAFAAAPQDQWYSSPPETFIASPVM